MISVAFCSMETARRGGEVTRRGRPQLISSVAVRGLSGVAPAAAWDWVPPPPPQAVSARRRQLAMEMEIIFIIGDGTGGMR